VSIFKKKINIIYSTTFSFGVLLALLANTIPIQISTVITNTATIKLVDIPGNTSGRVGNIPSLPTGMVDVATRAVVVTPAGNVVATVVNVVVVVVLPRPPPPPPAPPAPPETVVVVEVL
jgi:hypothetical protein